MRRYSSSPSKILIIHFTGRLGDSLFFTPILKSLTTKYSNSKIDYMCHRNTHELFLNFPGLNKISIISKRKAIFRGWFRQKKYDLAFVSFSHNEEFETIIKFANRVSNEIISFKPLDPLMEEEITHVAPREFSGHISSYYSNLISSIGIELITNRNQYFPTKDECNIAKNELKKFKSKKQIFIGFKLTSLKSRSYRDWPKENFLEFIHLLKLENIQPTLLALGGLDEFEFYEEVLVSAQCNYLNYSEKSIRQVGAMLPHLNFFIGVDTGITHLATCFDIPSIVIYHPDFPASKYGPIDHPRLKIIQAEYSSDKDKFKPLKSITAKMAIRVFKKLL